MRRYSNALYEQAGTECIVQASSERCLIVDVSALAPKGRPELDAVDGRRGEISTCERNWNDTEKIS